MKENKTTIIVIASVVVVCMCLGTVFAGLAGFYFYDNQNTVGVGAVQQATVPPSDYETVDSPTPVATPTLPSRPAPIAGDEENTADSDSSLGNLDHISVLPFTYSENGEEGVAIDLVFYDAGDEVISFSNVPIEITMEFYAFTDFLNSSDISAGDLVYTETVTRDHSSTLEEMFDNYIRIPYEKMVVDQNTYVSFGSVCVIVDTPNGSFEDTSTLVTLYPTDE